MLPSTVLPSGYLARMRLQAQQFFTTPISVYEVTISYNAYGREIVTSGLRFSVSGYVGAVKGEDEELLRSMGLTGSKNETKLSALIPIEYPVRSTDTVVINNETYRVIWENGATQDSVQVYQKAILGRLRVQEERRYDSG